ncbi:hypothetical protein PM8797T_21098 [Gimesia maris DSM 8797]|nr:hypothetical protein PM8797T_21098 [Gimesia maris DSM 8797]
MRTLRDTGQPLRDNSGWLKPG